MFEKTTMIICFLVVLASAVGNAQHCNRRIQRQSESGSLTIPLRNSGLTCLDVSPPDDDNEYILLKLPPSLSVSIDGKTYESADDLQRHCFVMTPFKRCSLWYENIRKTCPGGTTAQPIFGPTTVYIKTNAGSSQDGSNETTIEHELIHRYDGFFDGECTDLQAPTVAPTTASTPLDTTTPVKTSVSTEAIQDEFTTAEETNVPTTSTEPAQTTTTQSSSGAKGVDNSMDPNIRIPLIVCGVALALLMIVLLLLCVCRNKTNRKKATDVDASRDSQLGLMDQNGNANNSKQPGGSHDKVWYRRETGGE